MGGDIGARLFSPGTLLLRDWPEETVVFDETSGQTHLLAQPAGMLLAKLIEGPQTVDTLTALVSDATGTNTEEAAHYVRDTILSFRSLGLVTSADGPQ